MTIDSLPTQNAQPTHQASETTLHLMCQLIRLDNPLLGQYAVAFLQRQPNGAEHLLEVLPEAMPLLQITVIAIFVLHGEKRALPLLASLFDAADVRVRKAAQAAHDHLKAAD